MALSQVEQVAVEALVEVPKVPLMMVVEQVVVKQVDLEQEDQVQLIPVAEVEQDPLLELMAQVEVVK
jgi:hypothetical protein